MLDQLMQMIQQAGQQTVVENPAVPNEHNEAVMQEASSSIISSLGSMVQSGDMGSIQALVGGLQSGNHDNPAMQGLSSNFAGSIAEKFGISGGAAQSIAASLIPTVLGSLFSKASNGSGGFDISSILGMLTGGGQQQQQQGAAPAGGGMMDTISNIGTKLGFDKNNDGKTDLSDLMNMFGK